MPVLVSKEQGIGQPPIIGYNVIQHLVSKGMEQHPDVVPEVVREAFSFNCRKSVALILVRSWDEYSKSEPYIQQTPNPSLQHQTGMSVVVMGWHE